VQGTEERAWKTNWKIVDRRTEGSGGKNHEKSGRPLKKTEKKGAAGKIDVKTS